VPIQSLFHQFFFLTFRFPGTFSALTCLLPEDARPFSVVFCESVGRGEGYGAGRGVQPGELGRVVTMAMEVGREIVEASDEEVQRIQKEMQ
jgi:hypothetical protein